MGLDIRDLFGQCLKNIKRSKHQQKRRGGEWRRTGRKNLRLQCSARKASVRMEL